MLRMQVGLRSKRVQMSGWGSSLNFGFFQRLLCQLLAYRGLLEENSCRRNRMDCLRNRAINQGPFALG